MERKHYIDKSKKKFLEDGSIEYNGYIFHKDGYIINPSGKIVVITAKNGRMRLGLEKGKMIIIKAGRFAYELYHDVSLERSQIIKHLDGDLTNLKEENLVLVDRKEYFKDFNWTYKFDEEAVKQIKKEYENGNTSVQKLADKYECCSTTMWNIVNGNYKGTKKD